MSQPELSLVVLRTANVLEMLSFYRALGLRFEQERHGSGVVHYACTLGTTTIEIYPGTDGSAPKPAQGGATMLGFRVEDIDKVLAQLQELGNVQQPTIQSTPRGRRIVLQDFDGRKVELTEF
ncbi:MAG: VOC family protein [Calothrix sp. MO_167.B12]|nr:VOC family protein [Calothrix sp. MO_167.B12]